MSKTVILDVDGTLIDSVYQHALCWQRAFSRHGVSVAAWRCHRAIGMGGDQLVTDLTDAATEQELGAALREAESELFQRLIDEVGPTPGAAGLVRALADRGAAIVLASSGSEQAISRHIEDLGVGELIGGYTTADDVDRTKPHPDVIEAALEKVDSPEPSDCLMFGDSVWDVEAAARIEVPVIGVRCGGFSAAELTDAGAEEVFDDPGAITPELDRLLA